ncbi:MAG TPA: chemotaxis protein CheW [Acidimicrobiales bacterium]
MRALRLRVADDTYAIPMAAAREVLADVDITPLPTAPSSVLGVCNVRGEIIPVFDTGVLLGLGPLPPFETVVVVETPLGPAGLATSDLVKSVDLGDAVGTTDGPATVGAFAGEDGVAVLVDVEALLTPARIAS